MILDHVHGLRSHFVMLRGQNKNFMDCWKRDNPKFRACNPNTSQKLSFERLYEWGFLTWRLKVMKKVCVFFFFCFFDFESLWWFLKLCIGGISSSSCSLSFSSFLEVNNRFLNYYFNFRYNSKMYPQFYSQLWWFWLMFEI